MGTVGCLFGQGLEAVGTAHGLIMPFNIRRDNIEMVLIQEGLEERIKTH